MLQCVSAPPGARVEFIARALEALEGFAAEHRTTTVGMQRRRGGDAHCARRGANVTEHAGSAPDLCLDGRRMAVIDVRGLRCGWQRSTTASAAGSGVLPEQLGKRRGTSTPVRWPQHSLHLNSVSVTFVQACSRRPA